jgi:hypothetical protein
MEASMEEKFTDDMNESVRSTWFKPGQRELEINLLELWDIEQGIKGSPQLKELHGNTRKNRR